MDELTLLRRVRADVEEPSAAALADGRTALEAAWAGTTDASSGRAASRRRPGLPRRSRRAWRRAGWTAGGVALAFGIAAALVVTNVVGLPGGHGGASPAAASVLNDAADLARHASDPVVPPGSYLKLTTDAVYASITDDGSGGLVSYLRKNTDEQYIPADPSKTWIWVRPAATLYQTFGPASQKAAREDVAGDFGVPTEWVVARGGCYNGACLPDSTPAELAQLPIDPQKLLDHIYAKTKGQGGGRSAAAIGWIADLLSTGDVPAGVRADLYRAAALIPGVLLTDKAATVDGRTGTAIGAVWNDRSVRQDIIIDPDTGAFIGEREVLLKASSGMPAGTSMSWTAVTATVVGSAPRGTATGGFDASGCTGGGPTGGLVCPSR